jgi:hypothetical protein
VAGTSIGSDGKSEKWRVPEGKGDCNGDVNVNGKRDPSTAPRARRNAARKIKARGFAQRL